MYADLLSWIYERSPFEKHVWFSRIYLCFNNFKNMIVLKYQESTTEKFFENASDNLSFLGGGGQTKWKKKWVFGGSRVKNFSKFFESQIDMNHIFPGCSHILWNKIWGILVFPKLNKEGFGSQKHVKTLRNHEIWSFRPLK